MNIVALLLLGWAAAVAIPALFTSEELAYLKDDPAATHKVTFSITRDGTLVGDLVLALFGETVPMTVANFVGLAQGTGEATYVDSAFHRIVHDFVVQGGDFTNGDGTGGYSIYDKAPFADENFEIAHNKLGRLSMANSGPNTNGAQFFITSVKDCSSLNGKHVVFGQLVGGFDLLDKMNSAETELDVPVNKWVIAKAVVDKGEKSEKEHVVPTITTVDQEQRPRGYGLFFLFCLAVTAAYGILRFKKRRLTIINMKEERYF